MSIRASRPEGRRPGDTASAGKAGSNPPSRSGDGEHLLEYYRTLLQAAGHRGWWPGRTRLEIILGAILTQNTAWSNVEKALHNLRRHGMLRLSTLRQAGEEELAQLIRPSGYYRQKARKIRAFLDALDVRHGGSLNRMAGCPTGELRRELLSIWGIGPETADSVLLYAFKRPVFVVDAYTIRIFSRHGWIPASAGYDETQRLFLENLPADLSLYNDFHAQLVWVGHHFCRPKPLCRDCPLFPFLERMPAG